MAVALGHQDDSQQLDHLGWLDNATLRNLTTTEVHIYWRLTSDSQSVHFVLVRAITKNLVLHCLGLALALAAEAQHRQNFTRAQLFLQEEEAM